MILDATILSTAMSCARLTDLRFNQHLQAKDGKSKSLETGSIVHTILENYYRSVIDGKSRNDAIAIGMASGRTYVETDVNNADDKEIEWTFTTMEQYFEHYKNDSWTPLEVEVTKGSVLYEDDEIRVLWKAKLDVMVDTNQGIYPVDHKTMKQRRETVSLNNQFMGQCILSNTRGVIINKIGFQSSLKPADKFQRVLIPYTADRLMEWQSIILPHWAKQIAMWNETGYFPPNFTHCENKYGICQFRDHCEADRQMREEVLKQAFEVGEVWDV
jgi:hypothetical protein